MRFPDLGENLSENITFSPRWGWKSTYSDKFSEELLLWSAQIVLIANLDSILPEQSDRIGKLEDESRLDEFEWLSGVLLIDCGNFVRKLCLQTLEDADQHFADCQHHLNTAK